MSMSSGIAFKPPRVPLASLKGLSNSKQHLQAVLSGRPLPKYPPLRLSQILQLIENGNAEAVTLVEWLGLFNDDFSLLDESEEQRACLLLWQAISNLPRVARLALYIAANYLLGTQSRFPESLISTLDVASEYLEGINQTRIQWLIAIRDEDFKEVIRLAFSEKSTPLTFSEKIGMPDSSCIRDAVLHSLPGYIDVNLDPKHEKLVEQCITQMTLAERVNFFDVILEKKSETIEKLLSALESNCLPDSQNSVWAKLTPTSRDILSKKFQLGGYYNLKGIIDCICLAENAGQLQLTDRDIQQLRGRSAFWSNYSEHFNQSLLLLPESTAHLLNIKNDERGGDVIVMPPNSGNDAEVFIFELADKIIVEVLRGVASEIRFFELNERNRARLLNDNTLTLNNIRKMACDTVFDHVALWQYFCEKCLREEFNILPNKHVQIFAGLGKKFGEYSRKQGLPLPSEENIDLRVSQLAEWNSIFWSREARIKGGGKSSETNNGWNFLQLAKIASARGYKKEYSELIKRAADHGNSEAMCLHAETVFTAPNKTFNQWAAAERMVSNAHARGYVGAQKLIEKYKLNVIPASEFSNNDFRTDNANSGAEKKLYFEGLNLPRSLSDRIEHKSERPLVKLKIDELERLSEYLNDKTLKKVMINELEKRASKRRVLDLLSQLKK
ncbi:EH signature domain-containing protein [Alteromonas sp. ASW11-36]|uniref:EH signature domain-containing protein n=1 Tax=Alteromonas arenosi TaxID=3055817 RepID=A0ABT7T0E3_9ALTE|nr:EH signature domain-containing protein [Alteromonas sp. ASW11-36]MDM7861909.1 EH signature domain-containing protein [Alteromonas sp. ASW11-36]